MAISRLIRSGGQEYFYDSDEEGNLFTVTEFISQDGLNLLKTLAKIPVVSRVYDPECNVNYVVGMIRLLKSVKGTRWRLFDILSLFTNNAHQVDNGIIAEVIELGSKFIATIDEASDNDIEEASDILRIFYSMMMRRADYQVFPIDKRIAYAIKSGLLEMCIGFITRFECAHGVYGWDELMDGLVCIAELIYSVSLHQNTSKAIRDRQCQTVEALNPLLTKVQSEQFSHFVYILSSVMELNEGSCSRCNKRIEWHTALFCVGCRRVAYCGVKCQKEDWRYGSHSSSCSFLACSADMMGLTTFDVKSSRNISELTGLRNNIITSQKKLFLRHEVALSTQLLTYPDRSDYIAVFDLSNEQEPIIIEHYHDRFFYSKQRKWFEDFRSREKVVCLFTSQVLNGELDEEGNVNRIALFAAFPIPNCYQSPFTLYASATMSEIKSMNPESNSNENYATVFNMFQALHKEELAYWEEKAVLVRSNPSASPHIICDVAFKKSATKKSSAGKKKEPRYKLFGKEMCRISDLATKVDDVACAVNGGGEEEEDLSYLNGSNANLNQTEIVEDGWGEDNDNVDDFDDDFGEDLGEEIDYDDFGDDFNDDDYADDLLITTNEQQLLERQIMSDQMTDNVHTIKPEIDTLDLPGFQTAKQVLEEMMTTNNNLIQT
jgi:hypothetical protein